MQLQTRTALLKRKNQAMPDPRRLCLVVHSSQFRLLVLPTGLEEHFVMRYRLLLQFGTVPICPTSAMYPLRRSLITNLAVSAVSSSRYWRMQPESLLAKIAAGESDRR